MCQKHRMHSRKLLFLKTQFQLLHKRSWFSTEHITAGGTICPHLDVCSADVLLWAMSRSPLQSIERKGTSRTEFISQHLTQIIPPLLSGKLKSFEAKFPMSQKPIKNLKPVTSKMKQKHSALRRHSLPFYHANKKSTKYSQRTSEETSLYPKHINAPLLL